MKKHQLIEEVAQRTGASQASVRVVLDAAADLAKAAVARGDDVFLFGLGKLSVVRRREHLARNPRTGEQVAVPERAGVAFRPSTSLVEAASGNA